MLQKKYCSKAIKSAKPHFWASFRYCKSASILGETDSPQIANPKNCMINFIGRAQSSKFLQNSAQLCHKHSPKSRLSKRKQFELEHYTLHLSGEKLCICWSFKSANHKKDWVRKSQIRKVPHLLKVRKSNKLFKSGSLRNLFADRPPLSKLEFDCFQNLSQRYCSAIRIWGRQYL